MKMIVTFADEKSNRAERWLVLFVISKYVETSSLSFRRSVPNVKIFCAVPFNIFSRHKNKDYVNKVIFT